MQMMRTGPDVGEYQRPKMHHRQTIRIHRSAGLLRHEVIHHAEKTGGQKETYRIMAIPPLHHGILHTGVGRVGFHPGHRQRSAIHHMQYRHSEDERGKKPVGDIDMRRLALDDGAEKYHRIGYPYHRQQDVDGPFELGIFLGSGITQGQGDAGGKDHRLPAPKGKGRQLVAK